VQNPAIANATAAMSGTYHAIFTLGNGCADTINIPVTVSPITGPPIVSVSANPDTFCAGSNVTLSATVSNAGSPSYQWRRNGVNISGATSPVFTTSNVANGDHITCKVTSNAPCQPIDTATSNTLTMHVVLIPPPVVTLTTYPCHYAAGDTVTFTAHLPSNTNGFTYQWRKNGVDIPGANFSIYTSSHLAVGDIICIVVHSSVPCTIPDSTIACVSLTLNVNTVKNLNGVLIYPNPILNELIIDGLTAGTVIKLYNIIGQELFRGISVSQKETINTSYYATGTYILEISDANGNREIHKIVK
jgi:hypothetical protein